MTKLAQACELVMEDWYETFPEVLPEPEYSKKHIKWRNKLFDKMRGGYYHRFTTKTVRVMMVAAVLCALLLTAFVVPSSREFILDKFEKYTAFQLTEDNKNSVNGEINVGYIPDGFILNETLNSTKQIINRYVSNDGNFFTIYKNSSSSKVDFDTEGFVIEEIIIDGFTYTYCSGNLDVDNLIWTKNDYIYRIDGTFTKEEFIKIAENID